MLLGADEIDLVLIVFTETLLADPGDVMDAIAAATATRGKLLIATHVGGPARSVPALSGGRTVPVLSFPEPAAAAAGIAYRYARIRDASVTQPERPEAIDPAGARAAHEIGYQVVAKLARGAVYKDRYRRGAPEHRR